jgi:hypothetical protein
LAALILPVFLCYLWKNRKTGREEGKNQNTLYRSCWFVSVRGYFEIGIAAFPEPPLDTLSWDQSIVSREPAIPLCGIAPEFAPQTPGGRCYTGGGKTEYRRAALPEGCPERDRVFAGNVLFLSCHLV